MKKIATLLLIAVFLISSICIVWADDESGYSKITPLPQEEQFQQQEFQSGGDIYIGKPYDENSKDGYTETTIDGKKFLTRVRHIKRVGTDPNLYQSKFLMSLYRGSSNSTTETVTDTRSVTNSYKFSITNTANTEASFFGLVKANGSISITNEFVTSNTKTRSYTISKNETFQFPADAPEQCSYVNLYAGFTDDLYESVVDFVPYETYDKKTKVENITVSTRPEPPQDEPKFQTRTFDIFVLLEDGRNLHYTGSIAPHHYKGEENLKDTPEVRGYLSKFEDGYYHEITAGYNYDNKHQLVYEVKVPIPVIKWQAY